MVEAPTFSSQLLHRQQQQRFRHKPVFASDLMWQSALYLRPTDLNTPRIITLVYADHLGLTFFTIRYAIIHYGT